MNAPILKSLALGAASLAAIACASAPQADRRASALDAARGPQDEVVYFVLPDRFANGDPANDRGGLEGGRLDHGFDPTDRGFYQGGDLKGLTARLDYIQGLGATAIWLSPIFKNKPVQGPPGLESSAYHGYWITDFLDVDPHFGSREDFKAFVEAAHARGMKVYMDIITNHTADVIKFEECHGPSAPAALRDKGVCPYRFVGDYPYTTQGGPGGEPINPGFLGHDPVHQTEANFARLVRPDFAYTPFIPQGEEAVKNPAWLNDPIYYHNRGDTYFIAEDSLLGDFAGLDDLMTENPFVVEGFIDIYKQWISDFRVDGFRIDTAKHVNPEFWQVFTPAILEHARREGIEDFHVFGEVYEFDAGQLARFTKVDQLPTVLDFAFQGAVRGIVADGAPTRDLERVFNIDDLYVGGAETARKLPTFLGNHDMGRFAGFLREADPTMSDAEMLARLRLAHAFMFFTRGAPVIYYGDEQGFVSDGGDRGARESMFPSRTPDYNDNDLVGTNKTTADDNFDTSHPLYRAIAEMAAVRTDHPVLRRGAFRVRRSEHDGGLLIVSHLDEAAGYEYVVGFNAEETTKSARFAVDGRAVGWQSVRGACQTTSPAGTYGLSVPALDFVICRAPLDR